MKQKRSSSTDRFAKLSNFVKKKILSKILVKRLYEDGIRNISRICTILGRSKIFVERALFELNIDETISCRFFNKPRKITRDIEVSILTLLKTPETCFYTSKMIERSLRKEYGSKAPSFKTIRKYIKTKGFVYKKTLRKPKYPFFRKIDTDLVNKGLELIN